MVLRGIIFSTLFFVCSCVSVVHAQFADVLTITAPKSVRVGTGVRLTLTSPSFALERAMVVWTLDTKEKARGIGRTSLDLTLGDTAPHEVRVSATDTDGITRTESLSLRASDLDLLFEAETLTPPLYRGRALVSKESVIKAEAVLHDAKDASPSTHIYTWVFNGRTIGAASGVGKNSLRVTFPPFQTSATLEVSAQTLRGEFVGYASVRIPAVTPFVTFYPVVPLVGLWTNTAIVPGAPQPDANPHISAFPFFISARGQNDPSLSYEWALPPGSSTDEGSGEQATMPASEVIIGTPAPFSVVVRQKKTLLQEAFGAGTTTAASSGGTNLFGL